MLHQCPVQPDAELFSITKFAFPDDEYLPAEPAKLSGNPPVSLHICGELSRPELIPGFRCVRVTASAVPVPETAVDKDDRPVSGQHYVGTAGQRLRMQPEAVTQPVQDGPYGALGIRVLPADSGHVPAASFLGQAVHQPLPPAFDSTPHAMLAICLASSGGTAFPTWMYWLVLGPQKK